jgi:hypothetical protein
MDFFSVDDEDILSKQRNKVKLISYNRLTKLIMKVPNAEFHKIMHYYDTEGMAHEYFVVIWFSKYYYTLAKRYLEKIDDKTI